MTRHPVIKLAEEIQENGYVDKIVLHFKDEDTAQIIMITKEYKIRAIKAMIEANCYTRKDLGVNSVVATKGELVLECEKGIQFNVKLFGEPIYDEIVESYINN